MWCWILLRTGLEDVFKQCGIRGQIDCLASMLDRFVTAVEELRDRIAELEDEEEKGSG